MLAKLYREAPASLD